MIRLQHRGGFLIAASLFLLLSFNFELQGQDIKDLASLQAEVAKLEQTIKEKKIAASVERLDRCTQAVLDLIPTVPAKEAGDWKKIHGQLTAIHERLVVEGAEPAELPGWADVVKLRKKGAKPGNEKSMPQADGVSFSKEIAPWLIDQCGRCHIAKKESGLSLESFAALMKGSTAGKVVFPGDIVGSKLVESIETGDMPRGGNKVTPENLAKLKLWISQGAKLDTGTPDAPLTSLVPNAKPIEPNKAPLKPMSATGSETVSFSRDVAPILTANCNGCHYQGMRASGGLRFDNFAQILKGGDSGEIVEPGKGEDSLLIKKLKGTAGQRMPAGGRPALSDENIKIISTWISEGAKFDGDSTEAKLDEVIGKAWATKASHEDLMSKRIQRAKERWKIVAPKTEPDEAGDSHIHVIGNVGPETASKILALANNAETQAKKYLKISGREPLLKGGITVFVLKQRYDYSEFGKMLESRELPPDWSSHWRRGTLDSYVAIIYSSAGAQDKNQDKIVESSLVQQMTSLWVASQQGTPVWLADGVGRHALALMVSKNDARTDAWLKRGPNAMAQLENLQAFIDGKVNDEDLATIGFAIVRFMNDGTRKKQYDAFIKALASGTPFDQAMQKTFGPIEPFLQTLLGRKK